MLQLLAQSGGDAPPRDIVFTRFFTAFGPVIAVYAISAFLRLRSEVLDWLADPVLVTPITRGRWMGSHFLVAVFGQVVVLFALGLTSGLTYGLGSGVVGRELSRVLAVALVFLPAVWVTGSIAAVLFALLPSMAFASWVGNYNRSAKAFMDYRLLLMYPGD